MKNRKRLHIYLLITVLVSALCFTACNQIDAAGIKDMLESVASEVQADAVAETAAETAADAVAAAAAENAGSEASADSKAETAAQSAKDAVGAGSENAAAGTGSAAVALETAGAEATTDTATGAAAGEGAAAGTDTAAAAGTDPASTDAAVIAEVPGAAAGTDTAAGEGTAAGTEIAAADGTADNAASAAAAADGTADNAASAADNAAAAADGATDAVATDSPVEAPLNASQKFAKLLEENTELRDLVKKSISQAARVNPDLETDPVRSLDELYDFIDYSLTCMPWNILNEEKYSGFAEKCDQSMLYVYWLLDQELDELKDKGYYRPSVEYIESVSWWLTDYNNEWRLFLDSAGSWKDEYYQMLEKEPNWNLDKGWYEDKSNWHSFNDFFSRKLSSDEARPIEGPDDVRLVTAPADSLPQGVWSIAADGSFFDDAVKDDQGIEIKSSCYTKVDLLLGEEGKAYAEKFYNGTLTHTYLNYDDYHRYHFPVSGTVVAKYIIPYANAVGGLVYWNPDTSRYVLKSESLSWQGYETRGCVIIDTGEYGLVAVLPVGMGHVSSVNFEEGVEVGQEFKKGDPLGYFLFGGSDCVMIFEKKAGFELLAAEDDTEGYSNGYAHVMCRSAYGKMNGDFITENSKGKYSEGTVYTNGFKMDYVRFGKGAKTLIALPGASVSDLNQYAEAAYNRFAGFENDYTVYFFDRADNLDANSTIEKMAADTAAAIEKLGIKEAYFVGNSLGGMTAQCIAAEHPELVSKLVLCSTTARTNDLVTVNARVWQRLAESGNAVALNRDCNSVIYSKEYYDKNREAFEAAESNGTKEQLEKFSYISAALTRFNAVERLADIKCPIFVVGSQKDAVTGVDSLFEIAAKTGCEVYISSGYSHAIYDEMPEYITMIKKWLDAE